VLYNTAGQPQIVAGLNGTNASRFDFTVVSEANSNQIAASGVTSGRVGARYYFRLNAGYQTTGDGPGFPGPTSCTNDKYSEIGADNAQDYWTAGNGGFRWGGDGGTANPNWTPASRIGHWISP
jgi:hypothetical protein